MTTLVKHNRMTYDGNDPRCQLFIADTSATSCMAPSLLFAFISVVDDSTQMIKRYCGIFSWDREEECIREMMNVGGKWPMPFRDVALPKTAELYE